MSAADVWATYELSVRGPFNATDPETAPDYEPLLPALLHLDIDGPEELLTIQLDLDNARALRDALTTTLKAAKR